MLTPRQKCPRRSKIVLGDFKAGVSKESIFGKIVAKYSHHDERFLNRFAGARNTVVCGTKFPYNKIHQDRSRMENRAIKSILL